MLCTPCHRATENAPKPLVLRLCVVGYADVIAASAVASATYEHASLRVHRYAADLRSRLDLAHGVRDEIATDNFRTSGAQARPDIGHLHGPTATVSERLVEVAHAPGARVVFTIIRVFSGSL